MSYSIVQLENTVADAVAAAVAQRDKNLAHLKQCLASARRRSNELEQKNARLRSALIPFITRGHTVLGDIYNARKELGMDPYDDEGAERLIQSETVL